MREVDTSPTYPWDMSVTSGTPRPAGPCCPCRWMYRHRCGKYVIMEPSVIGVIHSLVLVLSQLFSLRVWVVFLSTNYDRHLLSLVLDVSPLCGGVTNWWWISCWHTTVIEWLFPRHVHAAPPWRPHASRTAQCSGVAAQRRPAGKVLMACNDTLRRSHCCCCCARYLSLLFYWPHHLRWIPLCAMFKLLPLYDNLPLNISISVCSLFVTAAAARASKSSFMAIQPQFGGQSLCLRPRTQDIKCVCMCMCELVCVYVPVSLCVRMCMYFFFVCVYNSGAGDFWAAVGRTAVWGKK